MKFSSFLDIKNKKTIEQLEILKKYCLNLSR